MSDSANPKTGTQPTAAEASRAGAILSIDVGALSQNYRRLTALGAADETAAVVKANGYGLGIDTVAQPLWDAGARLFFVALPEEGLQLRQVLPQARIAVLNGLFPDCEAVYDQAALTPVLNHRGEIDRWAGWCTRINARRPAFIQLDTGMNRLGLNWVEQQSLANDPGILETMTVAGYLTHPTSADDAESQVLDRQRAAFDAIRSRLPPAPASIANSPAMFRPNGRELAIARPGCALYGINPTPEAENPMDSVVTVKARVLQVREIDAGDAVGYGGTATVARPTRIATVSIGYADGYLRSIGNRGHMAVDGRRVPVIGRISMDLTTLDISGLPDGSLTPGDWVEVMGRTVPVDEVAEAAGTIGYEILTALGHRFERKVTAP